MLKILNIRVYGLEESVLAGGYPMRADEITEWTDEDIKMTEVDLKRAVKLGTVPTGTGHDNFLKGITVHFDVTYPNYWTPQFQRYSFHDIVSSTSKMHRLTSMDVRKCCNKYVSTRVIEEVEFYISQYNTLAEHKDSFLKKMSPEQYDKEKYEAFMRVVSNCPLGFEQSMRVTTNYLQLKTIYLQRRHHKLKEDWGAFCKMCEELPYFMEFCIK